MSMPEFLARELIHMNIAKWSTLEPYKEESLRNTPGLYEAAFCKHNQVIAAKQVVRKPSLGPANPHGGGREGFSRGVGGAAVASALLCAIPLD